MNTTIYYAANGKHYETTLRDIDYKLGEVSYRDGIINQIEAITDAGGVITGIIRVN